MNYKKKSRKLKNNKSIDYSLKYLKPDVHYSYYSLSIIHNP